jgi:hypothetical protein
MAEPLITSLWEIKKRGTFDAFNRLCPGYIAYPFQSVSIINWLFVRRGLFAFDPGMGKTITACMGLMAVRSYSPGTKCIFFIRKSQLAQTSNDVRMYTGLNVMTCTGEQENIDEVLYSNLEFCDVLMLTYETLLNTGACFRLIELVNDFSMCVADEVHFMSNLEENDRVFVFSAILERMSWVAFLTATPFISKPEQYATLLHLMDRQGFPSIMDLKRRISSGEKLDVTAPCSIYNYTRDSIGMSNTYNPSVIWVDPMPGQRDVRSSLNYLEHMTGRDCVNQKDGLITILKRQIASKKRGIVYVYYHDTREWLTPFLDECGFKYGCINGLVPLSVRDDIQCQFNAGLLDFVILSTTTSINLDCDYVFFYQYNLEFKQVLGRGERDVNPKVMDLFFLFTRDTHHAQHFLDTVYKLSLNVRTWIGKEYTEFLEVGEYLRSQ